MFCRGRVRGGATYTTASSNDIDRGTPLAGYVKITLFNRLFKTKSHFNELILIGEQGRH